MSMIAIAGRYKVRISSRQIKAKEAVENRTILSQKFLVWMWTFGGVRNEKKVRAFGERLRQLRKDRNWSQEELALEADIALKTVQRLERAEYSGTLDILFSIAEALKMDPGELLQGL